MIDNLIMKNPVLSFFGVLKLASAFYAQVSMLTPKHK